MSQPRRIALLIALATLVLYVPVAWFDFVVYDDGLYVTENPVVQAGVTWAGIKWAFTKMAAANWHPLTWVSHMVDCGLFGLNPAEPHLVNALLHSINAALLFILLFRLTEKIWPAAFITALFAWHPMHVESVAWISERKDVLSSFFALLALLSYTNFAKQNCRRSYWVALLCFALGIMAKPMIVTLPCILLLLDFWPLRRVQGSGFTVQGWGKLLLEKIPFFLVTAAASLLTFIAQSQQKSKAVVTLDIVPLHYRLENLPVAYAEYLCKIFWPATLAIFYPLPDRISPWQVAVSTTALVCISAVAVCLHRKRPYWLTGWLWFTGMLVPVIGLVQVGGAQIADRYSYLPSIGIFIIVTFGALDLAERWRFSKKILGTLAVSIVLGCIVVMELQLWHWRNSETLFRHALAVTADNDVARNNLGVALEKQNRLAEAAVQFRAATDLAPDRYQGPHNLGNVLDHLGQHSEALAQHRAAVKIDPTVQFLHHTLGLALVASGQPDEALKEFAEAARLDPHYGWPDLEIARIYLQQGRDAEAVEALRAAIRASPDNIEILTFAAQVLAASENPSIRNGQAAFVLVAKANLLTSGSRPATLDVMGMACAELGKFDEAQSAAEQALEVAAALKLNKTEPIQQRLALYKQHQPWRESFRATNAPVKN